MGFSDIILNLGFRRTFDGTINGDTENSISIKFAIMYLLSFFVEKKTVLIKFKLQCLISFINKVWRRT